MLAVDQKKSLWLAWLFSIVVAVVFAGIFLRHSTFYHADTTWQLYSAWSVMQPGHSVDFLSSLRPGYLLNVPAMSLFGVNLYALRLVTYVVALCALAVFIGSMRRGAFKTPWYPIILVLASICQLKFTDYIFSYYNAPWIFLCFGLGLFWLSTQYRGWVQCVLSLLAGIAIAIASFSNLALLPAGFVALLILLFVYQRRSAWYAIIGCVVAWGILSWLYFGALGVGHQLMLEHARGTHGLLETLGEQVKKVVVNAAVLLAGVLLAWIGWYFIVNKVSVATPSYFRRYFVLNIIIALGFFWLAQAIIGQGEAQYDTLAVYFYSVLLIPFIWMCFWRSHSKRHKWVMTTNLAIVLVFIFDHGGTTQNPYFTIFSIYLPMLVALLLGWFFYQYRNIGLWRKGLMVGLVCFMYVYPLLAQDATVLAKGSLWQNRFVGPYGAEITQHEAKLIAKAQRLYHQYHCQNKWFFAFYDEPKWYVIFKRHAPFDQSWVSRVHFYPRNKAITPGHILGVLKQKKNWCVIYGADHGWYAKGIAAKNLQPVVRYLKSQSAHQIRLGKDVSDNQTVLYFLVK